MNVEQLLRDATNYTISVLENHVVPELHGLYILQVYWNQLIGVHRW